MKTLTELRIFDCKRGPKGGCQLTEEAFGIPLVDIINSLNDAMKDPPEILKPLDEHLAKYIEGKTLGFLLYKLNKGAI